MTGDLHYGREGTGDLHYGRGGGGAGDLHYGRGGSFDPIDSLAYGPDIRQDIVLWCGLVLTTFCTKYGRKILEALMQ